MATYAQRRELGTAAESPKRRDVRRQATRDRLLDAARELFFREDYFELSIDDIAKSAGLSRAAFYLHYPNKEAILVDIVRGESARLDPLYRWFGETRRPTKTKIREFVRLLVRLTTRSHRQLSLFYQATSYNAEVWRAFAANRDRHIDMLGESIPAFRLGGRATAKERRRRARAHLLFYQLEQMALYATFSAEWVELDEEVDGIVDAFQDFIREFSAERS